MGVCIAVRTRLVPTIPTRGVLSNHHQPLHFSPPRGVCVCVSVCVLARVCVLACVSVRRPFAIGPSRAPSAWRARRARQTSPRAVTFAKGCQRVNNDSQHVLNYMYYTSVKAVRSFYGNIYRPRWLSPVSFSNNKVSLLRVSNRTFLKVKKGTRHIRSHFLNS